MNHPVLYRGYTAVWVGALSVAEIIDEIDSALDKKRRRR